MATLQSTSGVFSLRRFDLWWFVALVLGVQLVYISGATSWYCGDDFQYVLSDPASRIFYYFFNSNPGHGFYRPVTYGVNALVQALAGWETWPIHLLNVLAHAFLAWLVYQFMLKSGHGRRAGIIGSAFMMVTQGGSAAVLQNDTISQITGTLFGCLSLWFLHLASTSGDDKESAMGMPSAQGRYLPAYYLASLLFFVVSLASKETSVGFAPMIGVLILLRYYKAPGPLLNRLLRIALEFLPYLILLLLYMWFRSSIGASQPAFGTEGYSFRIGVNVPLNLLQLGTASVVPISTVTVFDAVQHHDLFLLILVAAGSILFVGLIALGLRLRENRRWLGFIGFCGLAGTIPPLLLNHVGELYLYNSLPFIAVIVGIGIVGAFERTRGIVRWGIVAFLMLFSVLNLNAIREKGVMITENGVRARRLLEQIAPYITAMPQNGYLLLVNPPTDEIPYSVYRMPGFRVFEFGTNIFSVRTGRKDVYIVLNRGDSSLFKPAPAQTILTLQGDSVVPVTRSTNGE